MPIVSHRYKFIYYPMPKNASTSLKSLIFKIEFKDVQERGRSHLAYASYLFDHFQIAPELEDKYFHFFVYRDPIKRFISSYINRIWEKEDIKKTNQYNNNLGDPLPDYPDINDFIENLEDYILRYKSIFHHFIPQFCFLNKRVKNYYGYDVAEIYLIEQKLEELCGKKLETPKRNVSVKKPDVNTDITAKNLTKLYAFYQHDYQNINQIRQEKNQEIWNYQKQDIHPLAQQIEDIAHREQTLIAMQHVHLSKANQRLKQERQTAIDWAQNLKQKNNMLMDELKAFKEKNRILK